MRIHLATRIDASPAQVWAAIEDIATHVEWMADAESITFRSPQRSGVGTEFECLTRVGPLHTTDVMRITEWEPAAVMGIVHSGVVTGAGRFTLEPDGDDGTLFTWAEELRFPWWMGGRLGERCGRPVLERIWQGNLRRLRSLAERHDPVL